MRNHWPIPAALLLVAAVTLFAIFRHEKLLKVAEETVAPAPAAPAAAPSTAGNSDAAGSNGVAPAANPVPEPKAPPAEELTLADVKQIYGDVRDALCAALNVKPAPGHLQVDAPGVQIRGHIVKADNWDIILKNQNPKAPQVDSPNSKLAMDTVAKALQFDKGLATAQDRGGNKVLHCNSRLGPVLVRFTASAPSMWSVELDKTAPKPVHATPLAPAPGAKPPPEDNF